MSDRVGEWIWETFLLPRGTLLTSIHTDALAARVLYRS